MVPLRIQCVAFEPAFRPSAALPSNLPPQVKSRILQLSHDVFAQAYLNAMRPSLAVAIAVLLFGALLTTGIVRRKKFSAQPVREAAPATG